MDQQPIQTYPKGDAAIFVSPGDIVLTHNSSLFGYLIRWGQRLRFRGDRSRYAYYNHVAMVTSEQGGIVEAINRGVSRNNLSKYTSKEYTIVHTNPSVLDVSEMMAYLDHHVGAHYGFTEVFFLGLSLLTGLKFVFMFDEESICSGLVASALERGEADFPKACVAMLPADLAEYYHVSQNTT